VQDVAALNVSAARGVAVQDFGLQHGHGTADYLLYADGRAAGVVEAKTEGHTLTVVVPAASTFRSRPEPCYIAPTSP
jgi:type I restriction enzyme R subunit